MIAIAAMCSNRGIGLNNKLPWPNIREDMLFFKNFTKGQKIVMGRKTFESVGMLPDREIYVLTSSPSRALKKKEKDGELYIINSLKEIPKKSIICGGAQLYSDALEMCSHLYLTFINYEFEADTFMPYFEDSFTLGSSIHEETKDGIQLEFRYYLNNLLNDVRG